ncbi:MAG: hypothetical protein JWO74_4247 [Solirubrobacterales bacterium]|nr:hypothetical protein [Solirubrobacterales bacterium]
MAETADVGMSGGPPIGEGAGGQATGAAGHAQETAHEVAGQAKEQARQVAGQARVRVREQVDRRSAQAGQQVSSQANDLRSVGDELRRQGKDGPAKLADQVAERTERLGQWLTRSDADAILDDVEDLGRRNPWALVAGGMALGFAASRFLKASSTQRYEARGPSRTAGTPARTLVPPATATPPVPPAQAMPVPAPSSPIGAA